MVDIRSSSGHPAALLRELVDTVGPLARARLGALEGEAFLARLEQVHLDVVEPLEVLYGTGTDIAELVRDLVGVALDAAAVRPWPLRVLDRRREVDPAWFQRAADGRLRLLRRPVRRHAGRGARAAGLPGRARRDVPAPDAAAGHRAPAPTTAATRWSTTTRSTRGSAPWPTSRSWPPTCTARGIALCVDLVLNHTAREHRWARRAAAGDPAYRDFYLVFPDRTRAGRVRADAARGLPGHRAGQLHPRRRSGRLGVDDVPRLPVGPGLHEPRGVRGDAAHDARPGQPRGRRAAAGRGAVPVEADGHRLPEPARGAPAGAGVPGADPARRAGRAVQGRGDRRARTCWCSTSARTTATAPSATWPTTTSSWCCSGRRWRPGTPGWPRGRCPGCGRPRPRPAG